jgi:demethylmenaquinone methyltransferase/2-methoxy-6-polyprenyl-1,4-benzoquinol methylase
MPAIGSKLTGDRDAYEYLPETAEQFPCRAEFTELMAEAGFVDNRWKAVTGGIAFMYRGRKS